MIKYFYRDKDKLVYQIAYRNNPGGGVLTIALQLDSTETAMLACKDVPGWESIDEPEYIDEYYCNLETDDFGDYEEDYGNDNADLTFSTLILKNPDGSYRQIDTTSNSNRAEQILNLIRNRKYGDDDPENNEE